MTPSVMSFWPPVPSPELGSSRWLSEAVEEGSGAVSSGVLDGQSTCNNECRLLRCGDLNSTIVGFTCSQFESVGCECGGCCADKTTLPGGIFVLVAFIAIWLFCFGCFCRYRGRARRQAMNAIERAKNAKREALGDAFHDDDPTDDLEQYLDERGQQWVKHNKHRYALNPLGLICPWLPVTCPDLYGYLRKAVGDSLEYLGKGCSDCLKSICRAWQDCRGHLTHVERTINLGIYKTKSTVELIKREADRTKATAEDLGTRLEEGTLLTFTNGAELLKESAKKAISDMKRHNITGFTIHNANQIEFAHVPGQVGVEKHWSGAKLQKPPAQTARIDLAHVERFNFVISLREDEDDDDAVERLERAATCLERAAREARAAAAAVRNGAQLRQLQEVIHAAGRAPPPIHTPSYDQQPYAQLPPAESGEDTAEESSARSAEGRLSNTFSARTGEWVAEPTAPAAAPAASSEAAASGEQPASSSSGGGGVVATAGDALEDHLASSEAFREYRKSFAARQSISADRPARKSFAALYGEERQWGAQERKSIAAKRESVHIKADWSENGSEDEEEEAHGGVESGVALAIPQKSEETPVAGHEAGGPSDGGPSEEVLAPAPSAASSPKGRGGIFSMLRRKQTEPTEEPEEVAEEAAEETPAQKSRRERLERLAKLEEVPGLHHTAQAYI